MKPDSTSLFQQQGLTHGGLVLPYGDIDLGKNALPKPTVGF